MFPDGGSKNRFGPRTIRTSVAVDTRSRIPSTVLSIIVYSHSHRVCLCPPLRSTSTVSARSNGEEVVGNIVLKSCVSVRMRADQFTVNPGLSVHIDPIKLEIDPLPGFERRRSKLLPVPPNTAQRVRRRVLPR